MFTKENTKVNGGGQIGSVALLRDYYVCFTMTLRDYYDSATGVCTTQLRRVYDNTTARVRYSYGGCTRLYDVVVR